MPAPRLPLPTEDSGQSSKRSVAVFFDQHKTPDYPDGRPWWGYAEAPANPRANKGIVGELLPVSVSFRLEDGMLIRGWDAPWLPEAKYISASVSSIVGNRFKINYNLQIGDYRTANERYYRLANEEAMSRNLPGVAMYGAVPFQVRSIKGVGNPPKSPKLPEAALGGDPWILGFSPSVNEQLKNIMDRDNGRMSEPLESIAPDAVAENPLAALSSADMADLAEFLKERKAKAAKKTQPTAA